jgi:two-component system, chemotaxis family, CheB/CheR fusion protein
MILPASDPQFEALLTYLKRSRGFDFTGYKRSSLLRRIQRRMQTLNIEGFEAYMDFLEVHPHEFEQLFNTILINVTEFFRDPEAWKHIDQEVIPKIIESKNVDEPIRVWSAGVASGEEAYSVAILLAEHMGLEGFKQRVKIYATDLDEDALNRARAANYSEKEISHIGPDLLNKYFESKDSTFTFHKELRRCIVFGRHELIHDAPISRVDLLLCRNILMYFNSETQSQILNRLHFALNDQGYLMLGKAEMLLTHAHLFTPVDYKQRVFKKILSNGLRDRTFPVHRQPGAFHTPQTEKMTGIRASVFESSVSPQMVIDLSGTLIMANQRACDLFRLSMQDIGRQFKDLRVSYQPVELRSLIEQAFKSAEPIVLTDVSWHASDGTERYFNVVINGLVAYDEGLVAVSVSFQDVTQQKYLQFQVENANHELETAMEELESTNEELETTNEELQSTIEELETTNEELQSTNEELETMNEELQSTNEELETMNEEINKRSEEINQVNNFLNSILSSLKTGVIVVNNEFQVDVWNPKSEDQWGLRREEVFGHSIFGLDIGLPVDKLKRPIRNITNGYGSIEELELSAVNRRGRNITINISISPIKNYDGNINGAILILDEKD